MIIQKKLQSINTKYTIHGYQCGKEKKMFEKQVFEISKMVERSSWKFQKVSFKKVYDTLKCPNFLKKQ